MDAFFTYIRDHWIKIAVCFLIGTSTTMITLATRNGWTSAQAWSDACFVAAAILLGVGVLAIVNNFGGFDLFQYYFRRRRTEEGPEDFGSYVTRKGEERVKLRWGFLPYIVIGIAFLIPSIVLMALR